MNTFEQVLNKFQQVWIHLNNFEHIWTHLTNFEHIWTHLNSTCFDPFLELINLFLYICIFVSHVSDVSYVPREGAYICPLGSTSHFRYSDLPPTKIGKRCPTGNVPLALGQHMVFFNLCLCLFTYYSRLIKDDELVFRGTR